MCTRCNAGTINLLTYRNAASEWAGGADVPFLLVSTVTVCIVHGSMKYSSVSVSSYRPFWLCTAPYDATFSSWTLKMKKSQHSSCERCFLCITLYTSLAARHHDGKVQQEGAHHGTLIGETAAVEIPPLHIDQHYHQHGQSRTMCTNHVYASAVYPGSHIDSVRPPPTGAWRPSEHPRQTQVLLPSNPACGALLCMSLACVIWTSATAEHVPSAQSSDAMPAVSPSLRVLTEASVHVLQYGHRPHRVGAQSVADYPHETC